MEHPIQLPTLTTREAIIDALHRAVDGIDGQNVDLYKSAILQSKESFFEVAGGFKVDGADAINDYVVNKIIPLTTLHQVTGIRIEYKEGADTARLTAHATAHHYRPEDAFLPENKAFISAGLYFIDLVRDTSDGLWKIKGWTLKLLWSEGERSVIE